MNPREKEFTLHINPEFETTIKKKFALDGTMILICISGHRSAEAATRLVKGGFNDVYSIINGFEGHKITDKDSYYS